MNDEFKTIRSQARTETKIQGSRFIATALPASTKADTERFLADLRKEFRDATHNCFAYRLGVKGTQFRFNDDGEPGGSAGKPILATIDSFGLTDILVVVTRYFGGTKLGVGGLTRAYGDATMRVLAAADKLTKFETGLLEAIFPHSHTGGVMHIVSKIGARIVDTTYDEDVHARFELRASKLDEFKSALIEQTNGNVSLKLITPP